MQMGSDSHPQDKLKAGEMKILPTNEWIYYGPEVQP